MTRTFFWLSKLPVEWHPDVYPYLCGSCGLAAILPMKWISAHWREHVNLNHDDNGRAITIAP